MFLWPVLTAQAGEKQIFNGAHDNQVEVEELDNPTKVYVEKEKEKGKGKENGELYLIPGQTYTFKLTGKPTKGYQVVGVKPLPTATIVVPENPEVDHLNLPVVKFDNTENVVVIKPEIKIVRPQFTSLTVTGGFDPALVYLRRQEKGKGAPDALWQLGGQTKPHIGVVTFKPGAARVEFDICLEQWVSFKSFAKDAQGQIINDDAARSYSGKDFNYEIIFNDSRQPHPTDPTAYLSVIPLELNQLKAELENFPGLPKTRNRWNAYSNDGAEVTVTFKANLYLRYSLKNTTNWKTLGVVQWGYDAIYKPTLNETVTEGGHGSMNPKAGAKSDNGHATSEKPKAP